MSANDRIDRSNQVLAGRVAIVTGGSRGIGAVIARALADAGAAVVVTARGTKDLAQTGEMLRGRGAAVMTHQGDVADPAFCRRVVTACEAEFGAVDVLVNNAGIQGPIGPIETLSPDDWRYTLGVDLLGPVWLMQSAIPGMKERRRGSIINLSGGGATGPRERFSPYSAAKTALVRVTETVAHELAPFGIRSNAVAPGAVNTRMLEELELAGDGAGERAMAEARRQRETGGADPEIAAELIVFLASDAAAGITGRLISAVWDDWRGLRAGAFTLTDAEWFTLRRVTPSAGSVGRQ